MENSLTEEKSNFYSVIKNNIGKDVVDSKIDFDQFQITVPAKRIYDVLTCLHGNSSFCFNQLIDITAIDYPDSSPRFEIVYLLLSTSTNKRLIVKIKVDEGELVRSCVNIYKSANWSEREVWDMFGIFFSGHPDLRRLLTDYGFEGHPLRKDFPLTGRVQVKYDVDQNRVVYEPVKLIQEYREFDFLSPWETSFGENENNEDIEGDKN